MPRVAKKCEKGMIRSPRTKKCIKRDGVAFKRLSDAEKKVALSETKKSTKKVVAKKPSTKKVAVKKSSTEKVKSTKKVSTKKAAAKKTTSTKKATAKKTTSTEKVKSTKKAVSKTKKMTPDTQPIKRRFHLPIHPEVEKISTKRSSPKARLPDDVYREILMKVDDLEKLKLMCQLRPHVCTKKFKMSWKAVHFEENIKKAITTIVLWADSDKPISNEAKKAMRFIKTLDPEHPTMFVIDRAILYKIKIRVWTMVEIAKLDILVQNS